MKHFWLFLLIFPGAVFANDWLRDPDPATLPYAEATQLSENAYTEVSASTLERALIALSSQPFIPLSQTNVASFSSGHFTCVFPQQAYLVRAVYQNEGTGGFYVHFKDKNLVVSHGSLGYPGGARKTALVVCLRSAPTELFVSVSSAL